MPGATTARLVVCSRDMPMKLFMMPQTVPNRPTKGAVAPMVASTLKPRRIRRPLAASIRSSREAMRSLMPSRSALLWDSSISVTAAARNSPAGLCVALRRSTPSASRCTDPSVAKSARTRLLAIISSMVLASHTVQVTTDAKASPINTVFTSGSALRNMPHGVRSRSITASATIRRNSPGADRIAGRKPRCPIRPGSDRGCRRRSRRRSAA